MPVDMVRILKAHGMDYILLSCEPLSWLGHRRHESTQKIIGMLNRKGSSVFNPVGTQMHLVDLRWSDVGDLRHLP
jgi:hypothetical protein